jgi:hypothetical protein
MFPIKIARNWWKSMEKFILIPSSIQKLRSYGHSHMRFLKIPRSIMVTLGEWGKEPNNILHW